MPLIRAEGTKNYCIGMTTGYFNTEKKEPIADIKYNRKTIALARLHQKEIIHINFKESKILFPPTDIIHTL